MAIDEPPEMAGGTDVAVLLAQMKALAQTERERADKLVAALATNRTIGIALGLIMSDYGLGHVKAFAVLRTLSQEENRKMHDLACALLERHEMQVADLPPHPTLPPQTHEIDPGIHPEDANTTVANPSPGE